MGKEAGMVLKRTGEVEWRWKGGMGELGQRMGQVQWWCMVNLDLLPIPDPPS